jgi:GPH family glycoside/pentoside/hexuronide:cation symporter|tara:strand:+ start:49551 stop:51005 length:1455 start_codon:yes stop_codon:yes gene_type:complete
MTSSQPLERSRRLPLRTKLAFSAGSVEEAIVGAASMATMLFYNQVLGLSAGLCGVVFLIASIVDGVSDPLIGAFSDRFKSRWGRRHPLMLFAAMPLAIAFYCLYQPPDGLTETGLFTWFLGFMVLMRTAKTFYTVPHAALGAELTEDYHERTSIFGYNSVVGMIAGIGFGLFILLVVFPSTPEFSNGLLNESRYSLLAAFGAVIIVVSLFLCTFGTRDQIPYLHQPPPREIHFREYFGELWQLLCNRSYIAVCASWFVLSISIGILIVVSTYTYIYAFELSTEQLTIQRFVSLPGILIVLPLSVYLTKLLDKKRTLIYACLVTAFFMGLPFCLRLIDFFPGNDSPLLLVALFGPLFVSYLVAPLLPIVIDSQLADITDDHEHRTGHRSEGVVFSIRTFAMKATSGIGGLIGGFGLELIEFPEQAVPGEVAQEALNGLLFMSGPLYWIIVVASIGFMAMYQLSERRHGEIVAELKVRRARDASSR